jgi:hypothetical protein
MLPGKLPYFGFLCWLMLLSAGTAAVLSHDYATADAGLPPAHRLAAALPIPDGHIALVMFVHPQCPCTRASIAELASLVAKIESPISAHVFFYSPASQPSSWVEAEHWKAAAAIPDIHLAHDPEGALAAQFNAVASGFSVVYDARGTLAFAGGITASRGQFGASAGGEAVLRIARGESHGLITAPAFGCSLLGRSTN